MDTTRYASLVTALDDARIARHRMPQMGRTTAETTLAALIATLGERGASLPASGASSADGIATVDMPSAAMPSAAMPSVAMPPVAMPPVAMPSAAIPSAASPGRAGDRLRTSRRPGRPHVGAMPVLDRFAPSPDLDDDAFDGEASEGDASPDDAAHAIAYQSTAAQAHAAPTHAAPTHAAPAFATPAPASAITFDADAFDDAPDAFGPISTSFAMPAAFEIDADAFDAEPDAFDVFDGHPLDRLDGSAVDTGEASISTDDGLDTPNPYAALLRPPAAPPVPVPAPSPTPSPAPSPTRAAMHALFDVDDASGAGLVLFGDAMDDALDDGLGGAGDGAMGFAPQPGTDPDMAPLPDEAEADGLAEVTTDAALALIAEDDSDTSRPGRRRPTDEPVLAGAEAPVPMDAGDAPFGFGFGDDEPTVASPRPQIPPLDRDSHDRAAHDRSAPDPRDEPADPRGARRDETLLSSVRKLFRR